MFPDPVPALVIRYSYLWHSEFVAGREEGIRDRPCAIIAAVKEEEDGQWRVLLLVGAREHHAPYLGTAPVSAQTWCE